MCHLAFAVHRDMFQVALVPCLCRASSDEKSFALVVWSMRIRLRYTLEELQGRAPKGAVTNRFAAIGFEYVRDQLDLSSAMARHSLIEVDWKPFCSQGPS